VPHRCIPFFRYQRVRRPLSFCPHQAKPPSAPLATDYRKNGARLSSGGKAGEKAGGSGIVCKSGD
jgi:hypothetical protein